MARETTAVRETAAMPDGGGFAALADPYRRELLAHCYRMLGSVDEAEDQVQETYLRAWRSFAGFEGRSSLRTWLYRIATNACLNALEHRARRPLPAGLGAPADDPVAPLVGADVSWLQPAPDALLVPAAADPATVAATRASLRLALIAALQHLPPRQRAVLILRDVLAWRAAEVAELLEVSTPAVKSMLQRARERLARVAPDEDAVVEPAEPAVRAVLDRYLAAFERADVAALTDLLSADAALEMPPWRTWFAGRDAVTRFAADRILPGSALRMRPVAVNGQPGAAAYRRAADGTYRPHAIHVLTVAGGRIRRIVVFLDPPPFASFGIPSFLA